MLWTGVSIFVCLQANAAPTMKVVSVGEQDLPSILGVTVTTDGRTAVRRTSKAKGMGARRGEKVEDNPPPRH